MNHHSFEIKAAIDYDVETALLLNSMAFWTETNAANKKHIHDDRVWLFNSYEAWTILFPYWSSKQMRRILSNAETSGLIVTGNYNKRSGDLTKWYSLTDKAIEYYPKLKALLLNTPAQTGKPPAQTGKALPDTDTDPNPLTTTTTTSSSVFDETIDKDLLSLRNKHMPTDDRSNDEFLNQCKCHIDNGSKDHIFTQRIAGLKKIIKGGHFETPKSYKIKSDNKASAERILWSSYQSYVNSPIEIDLRQKGIATLMTFEVWKTKNA